MNTEHPSIDTIIDYVHHELAPAQDALLLAHLEQCDECRAAYEAEARVGELLRAHAHATQRELPQGVVATIWDRVETMQSAPSFGERLRAWLRPAIMVPAGIVAAAAVVFALTMNTHHDSGPVIDAAYYLNDHNTMSNTVPFGEGTVLPSGLSGDTSTTVATLDAGYRTADASH